MPASGNPLHTLLPHLHFQMPTPFQSGLALGHACAYRAPLPTLFCHPGSIPGGHLAPDGPGTEVGEKGPALFSPGFRRPSHPWASVPCGWGSQQHRAGRTPAVPAAAPRRGWLRGAEVAGAEFPPGLCLVSLPAQSLALGWGLALSARLRL